MSEVALRIGGRTYRVACAAGEEDRVARLGATISDKVTSLGNTGGTEAQNLVFAALLLADEVQESRESRTDPKDGVSTLVHDSESAAEQRRQLEAKIADLEAELSRAHDMARSAAEELDQKRSREDELTRAITKQDSDAESLRSRIAELEKQAEARAATPPPPEGTADLSALAPALEHFAQMLEECADKLERRAAAS